MAPAPLHRWIDDPIEDVWHRLVDLAALVDTAPDLELLEPAVGELDAGDVVVLARHRGPRSTLLQVRVVEAQQPRRLTLSISSARSRRMVSVALAPFGGHCTEATIRTWGERSLPGVADRRLVHDLDRLLVALTRRVEQPAPLAG